MVKKQQDLIMSQAAAVEARLRELLGSSVYDTWLTSLSVGGLKSGTLTLYLPTNFFCSYIARNFSDEITQAWKSENQNVCRIKFEVGSPTFQEPKKKDEEPVEEQEISQEEPEKQEETEEESEEEGM